jgi:hypothetical protein
MNNYWLFMIILIGAPSIIAVILGALGEWLTGRGRQRRDRKSQRDELS